MSREETLFGAILSSIRGETPTVPEPAWREEEFFCAILRSAQGEKPAIPAPVWRREEYLAAIAKTLQENQPVPTKDVNFFDYDGTLVASYTAAEFAELDAMPRNPIRKGLVAQGWNWTLADAKEYVAKYGKLSIGQQYVTTDGKTHVHVRLQKGRTSPYVGLCVNGTAVVDWGDGTAPDTLTGSSLSAVVFTPKHEYASPGTYDITIAVTGEAVIGRSDSTGTDLLTKRSSVGNENCVYSGAIFAVELGENVALGAHALSAAMCMSRISVPNGITVPESAFRNTRSLRFISIPSGVTSIGDHAFRNSFAMETASIPKSVTGIGTCAFMNTYLMQHIIIPDGVTSIGSQAFYNPVHLKALDVPDSVTSIGSEAFIGNWNASVLHIRGSVTSIAAKAFCQWQGMSEIHFHSATPPTIANSNVFSDLPADCKIYVPAGKLTAYTSAANYPSSGTYTYVEEDA